MASVVSKVLKNVTVFGVVGGISGCMLVSTFLQENVKKQEYYKTSVQLLNGYGAGMKILGNPVEPKRLEIGRRAGNSVDDFTAKVNIPVSGSRKSGYLVCWANRKAETDSWKVDKLDLSIDKKQWTFYINPTSRHLYKPTQDETEFDNELSESVAENLNNKENNAEICEAVKSEETT